MNGVIVIISDILIRDFKKIKEMIIKIERNLVC